jgi:hypothetical protein
MLKGPILPIALTAAVVVAFLLFTDASRYPSDPVTRVQTKNTNTQVADVQEYANTTHGFAFSYDAHLVSVTEGSNTATVTWNEYPTQSGQTVKVFQKETGETLEAAITRQLLPGLSKTDCFVAPFEPLHFVRAVSSQELVEVRFPDSLITEETPFGETSVCPARYRRTNAIRYFLMDTAHADRFFFFDIGQEMMPAGKDESWDSTFRVTAIEKQNPVEAEFQTYTNTEHKYSIQYPKGWAVEVLNHESGSADPNGNRTTFWSDPDYKSKLPEASEWVPTETLYTFSILAGDDTRDDYEENPEVLKLLKTETVTVGGVQGTKDTFEGPFNTYTMVYITKDNKTFGLTIPQLTDEQKTIAARMLASFTFN